MISEATTRQGLAAITSDQWHIVVSRLLVDGATRSFRRVIHGEYPDRSTCGKEARRLREVIARDSHELPNDQHDEVFVRKPKFKSLKVAKNRTKLDS